MRVFVSCLMAVIALVAFAKPTAILAKPKPKKEQGWEAIGLSGGGAMFCPAVSPLDPKLMMINCDMSCAFLSKDGGHNWKMIHYSQLQGNTRCKPAFHPTDAKVIFAAGGWEGRLKVTRDAGDTWSDLGNLPEGLRGEIAIDPERPEFMLTGSGERVFLSTDGGKQWNACKGPSGEATGFAFGKVGKSPRAMWAATKQGIWRSDDDGRSWNEKSNGLPSREIRSFSGGFDAKGKVAMLYCAVPGTSESGKYAGGVFASRDCGEKWESAMGEGINAETKAADSWAESEIAQYMHVATSNAKPLTVWAFNTNTGLFPPHHCGAYKSEDGGKTWKATFYPDPRMGKPYNVEPDYTTVGDGQYYQTVPNGVAICASNPDIALFVDGGNALVTDNGGKSWFNGHTRQCKEKGFFENTGLVVTSTHNYYVDPHEPKRHYICYTDIGFARSLDAGSTWHWWSKDEKAPWRNTCYELAFDPDTPGKIWGAFSNVHDIPNNNIIGGRHRSTGPGGLCVSTNFGETWTPLKGLPEAPCTSVALEITKKSRALYAGFFGKGVWKSTDDGKSWTEKNKGLGTSENMRVTRVISHADGTLFASITALRNGNNWDDKGVGLYRSRDKGETWEKVNASQLLQWPKDFTVDPKDSKIIYYSAARAAGQDQNGLWRTEDGGVSWKRIFQKGPEHYGAYLSPHNKGWIYATLCEDAQGCALWLSKDNGVSWAPMEELPFANVQRVAFDPDDKEIIFVTTFGGSVWKGNAAP